MNVLNEELVKRIQWELNARKMDNLYIYVTPKGKIRVCDLEDNCNTLRDDYGKVLSNWEIIDYLESVCSPSVVLPIEERQASPGILISL